MAMRRVLRVSARAFVSPQRAAAESNGIGSARLQDVKNGGGGNPVTIFAPSGSYVALTSEERSTLAQTCPWESIIIEPSTTSTAQNESSSRPTFRFFMPSGEEVSFCGHAAVGASTFLANKNTIIPAQTKNTQSEINLSSLEFDSSCLDISFITADGSTYESKVQGNEAELFMQTRHDEAECTSSESFEKTASLQEFLDEIGLESTDVASMDGHCTQWPTFINSSIARPKTLIPVRTLDRLHSATAPTDPTKFHRMCDSIDSTGIYLYSIVGNIDSNANKAKGLTFEARQFPKSSGYAEDPATGIAAGALAASLYKRGVEAKNEVSGSYLYNIYQGTAMGRPSRIGVNIHLYNDEKEKQSTEANSKTNDVNISYSGLVVFDSLSFSDLD